MSYLAMAEQLPTNAARVELYNKYADKPIKRFSDTDTAIRRTAEILELKGVKKKEEKEFKIPGPKSTFEGKKIYKLVKENPRRKGSHGYQSFELIRNGIKYETWRANGGRTKDLHWDVKHGNVEVR